jgi:hypothetical protein
MGVTRFPGATNRQVDFTSSGTWVCPSGVYSAKFLVVGAGGAGGGCLTNLITEYNVGGGGGGGSIKEVDLSVTPGTSYTITVGAKGTGGTGNGGNGGTSEVLNGATSLIKSYGGRGGQGKLSTGYVAFSTSITVAGGSGAAATSTSSGAQAGGGGSGFGSYTPNNAGTGTLNQGGEGTPGRSKTTVSTGAQAQYGITNGDVGYQGFGAGGGGGCCGLTTTYSFGQGGSANAGNGAQLGAAGATNGGAAIANTGCGGGGAAVYLSVSNANGGDGSDGLVRVVYFA